MIQLRNLVSTYVSKMGIDEIPSNVCVDQQAWTLTNSIVARLKEKAWLL